MEMFSFPDYSSTREQTGARMLDYTHTLFSKPVEIVMRKEGFHEFANFVQLVCN